MGAVRAAQSKAFGVLQLGVTRTDLVIAGTPVVVTVSVLRDGSMRNVTSEPVQVYVAVLEPAG